jgi:hypothetical protein
MRKTAGRGGSVDNIVMAPGPGGHPPRRGQSRSSWQQPRLCRRLEEGDGGGKNVHGRMGIREEAKDREKGAGVGLVR